MRDRVTHFHDMLYCMYHSYHHVLHFCLCVCVCARGIHGCVCWCWCLLIVRFFSFRSDSAIVIPASGGNCFFVVVMRRQADNKYMSRFEADKARADKEKVMKDRKRKAEARARSNMDMKV